MTKVKICGITNEEDALKAAILGADYLGFLVEIGFSEDKIGRKKARDIIKKLPLEVSPVFVTYLQKAGPIIEIAEEIRPAVIQLHNDISIEEIGKIREKLPKIRLTKTISVVNEEAVEEAQGYQDYVDYILLDTKSGKKKGGTGKVHDWGISRKIVKSVNKKVFLAGGLSPDNVEEAIEKVRPYAVDTNSGVKLKPGKKDYTKLELFIRKAKKR
ncbi:phosphoribosylanthranilate isomerase [Candidatus Woesearchaeota archaeon]|nr:phosphoribosylanthranilate isomerase [Candidatus Woesearchaeota archaeon]